MGDAPAINADNSAKVQHVNRKSSDELLRKFADSGDEGPPPRKDLRSLKRRKRDQQQLKGAHEHGDQSESQLAEKRSLLPPLKRRSVLVRKLGIKRSQLGARDIRNKSLLGEIQKTWRRTMEGASRVFMEKHYNRHKRLISDAV